MSEQPCEALIGAIERRNLGHWRGVAPGCTHAELARRWPTINDQPGLGRLGRDRDVEFWTHAIDDYPLPVKVWIVDDGVELVELPYPQLDATTVTSTLAQLGPPQVYRDYRLDVARFAGGAHVYADRGLTVFLDHGRTNVNKIWLYRACTLEEYDDRFEHERELHERPDEM